MATETRPWRSFRCHALRLHHWRTVSNPDGERYRACAMSQRGSAFAPPVF